MSVTVQDLGVELRGPVGSRLEELLDSRATGDLTFSRTCAHVLLESVRLLKAKKSERHVLSSTTFFLTAWLIGRRLAREGITLADADLDEELMRLRDWAFLIGEEDGVERLLTDFFVTRPSPSSEEFEILPTNVELQLVKIGPGLGAILMEMSGKAVDSLSLLLAVVESDSTGIGRRLEGEGRLVEALREAAAPRGGRHSRMIREAEIDELALGVDDYAIALATILRAARGEFTFALFGSWGSGKTTLIRLLKPYLEDPATYRKATSAANEAYADQTYKLVVHNAWKYRSRPEAWVYAYKSLANRASACFGTVGRLLLSLRTSIYRRGVWPIVGPLLMLALLSLPLTAKLQLAVFLVSVAGFSAILYLSAVITSVSGRVRALFAKHLRISPGNERLGMLALIGDDVKALINAWTRPPRIGRSEGDEVERPRLVLPIILLALVAFGWLLGLIGWGAASPPELAPDSVRPLIPQSWTDAFGTLHDQQIAAPSASEWLIFSLWCLLGAAMIPLPFLVKRGRPDRVLMVIDDLDRCSAEEMLDVIEGMRLLVEDSTINDRLQILMLVDEAVLNHAIALRYGSMIRERAIEIGGGRDPGAEVQAGARREIVAEQHEKLFACHLRLAPLADRDVAAVVESLAGGELNKLRRERHALDRQRLLRQREAANAALGTADAKLTSAEADYDRVKSGVPKKFPEAERQQSPWGTAYRELPVGADFEVRLDARLREEGLTGLSEQERLNAHPEVVGARDRARDAQLRAKAQLGAFDTGPGSDLARSARSDPLFGRGDVRFTAREVAELQQFVPAYLRGLGRRPSPRAVRMMLFKIQLCRLLLELRYPDAARKERSIEAILRAFATASGSPEAIEAVATSAPAEIPSETVSIAAQVV